MAGVREVHLKVGMEVHVELSTRTKMFTRAPNPAAANRGKAEGTRQRAEGGACAPGRIERGAMRRGRDGEMAGDRGGDAGGDAGVDRGGDGGGANTLIDPLVLGLPGSLPVLNRSAVEMSIRVGLALGCSIAEYTKWDRKSYFYADLPKNYQISQYDLPLCYDGALDVEVWEGEGDGEEGRRVVRVGITRAHLEEDAGKLLHEWPGGGAIEYSIADYNRAGTPLLEIVSEPDLRSSGEAEAYCRQLRDICRSLGVTRGVLQAGHMRFEPNINTVLVLEDGRRVSTPIVEVKNLNSFSAVRGAIEFELSEQPGRWAETGVEMGPGTKSTRGWDDARGVTVLQREKEDAHDYRYFPDPDLLPVTVTREWVRELGGTIGELPTARARRYRESFGLGRDAAERVASEPGLAVLFDGAVDAAATGGLEREKAGKAAANLIVQKGFALAGERGVDAARLGITAGRLGEVVSLRLAGSVSANGAEKLFEHLCDHDEPAGVAAERLGLVQVRDESQLEAWVDAALADPKNAQAVEDVRAGKDAAIGRLIGAVMKASKGQADGGAVREMIVRKVRG